MKCQVNVAARYYGQQNTNELQFGVFLTYVFYLPEEQRLESS